MLPGPNPEDRHAPRLYPDRTRRRHRDHRPPGRAVAPGRPEGPPRGRPDVVPQQPTPDRAGDAQLRGHQPRPTPGGPAAAEPRQPARPTEPRRPPRAVP